MALSLLKKIPFLGGSKESKKEPEIKVYNLREDPEAVRTTKKIARIREDLREKAREVFVKGTKLVAYGATFLSTLGISGDISKDDVQKGKRLMEAKNHTPPIAAVGPANPGTDEEKYSKPVDSDQGNGFESDNLLGITETLEETAPLALKHDVKFGGRTVAEEPEADAQETVSKYLRFAPEEWDEAEDTTAVERGLNLENAVDVEDEENVIETIAEWTNFEHIQNGETVERESTGKIYKVILKTKNTLGLRDITQPEGAALDFVHIDELQGLNKIETVEDIKPIQIFKIFAKLRRAFIKKGWNATRSAQEVGLDEYSPDALFNGEGNLDNDRRIPANETLYEGIPDPEMRKMVIERFQDYLKQFKVGDRYLITPKGDKTLECEVMDVKHDDVYFLAFDGGKALEFKLEPHMWVDFSLMKAPLTDAEFELQEGVNPQENLTADDVKGAELSALEAKVEEQERGEKSIPQDDFPVENIPVALQGKTQTQEAAAEKHTKTSDIDEEVAGSVSTEAALDADSGTTKQKDIPEENARDADLSSFQSESTQQSTKAEAKQKNKDKDGVALIVKDYVTGHTGAKAEDGTEVIGIIEDDLMDGSLSFIPSKTEEDRQALLADVFEEDKETGDKTAETLNQILTEDRSLAQMIAEGYFKNSKYVNLKDITEDAIDYMSRIMSENIKRGEALFAKANLHPKMLELVDKYESIIGDPQTYLMMIGIAESNFLEKHNTAHEDLNGKPSLSFLQQQVSYIKKGYKIFQKYVENLPEAYKNILTELDEIERVFEEYKGTSQLYQKIQEIGSSIFEDLGVLGNFALASTGELIDEIIEQVAEYRKNPIYQGVELTDADLRHMLIFHYNTGRPLVGPDGRIGQYLRAKIKDPNLSAYQWIEKHYNDLTEWTVDRKEGCYLALTRLEERKAREEEVEGMALSTVDLQLFFKAGKEAYNDDLDKYEHEDTSQIVTPPGTIDKTEENIAVIFQNEADLNFARSILHNLVGEEKIYENDRLLVMKSLASGLINNGGELDELLSKYIKIGKLKPKKTPHEAKLLAVYKEIRKGLFYHQNQAEFNAINDYLVESGRPAETIEGFIATLLNKVVNGELNDLSSALSGDYEKFEKEHHSGLRNNESLLRSLETMLRRVKAASEVETAGILDRLGVKGIAENIRGKVSGILGGIRNFGNPLSSPQSALQTA